MKRNPFIFLFLLFLVLACNSKESSGKPENDIDAARQFIRSALDGKFDLSRTLLLPDTSNTNYMDVAERNYEKSDDQTKRGYRAASINIHLVQPVNDSTTIVIYSNSFKNDHDTLRIVRKNSQWLVDLKYLYEHDLNRLDIHAKPADSLK